MPDETAWKRRFPPGERLARERLWKILCEDFFQSYVDPGDSVLDLGSGLGDFSRFIHADRKIAVDRDPQAAALLPDDVDFHCADARHLGFLAKESLDLCFTSNFFEHLPQKEDLDQVLEEVLRVLRPGGRLVALQPNIKYAAGDYWDDYDHHLPLSHVSCSEAFRKAGFEVEQVVGRFLPFTVRSRLPTHPALIRLYLRVRPAWWILGRQFLIVGRKP